jgi:hypothetical protein
MLPRGERIEAPTVSDNQTVEKTKTNKGVLDAWL